LSFVSCLSFTAAGSRPKETEDKGQKTKDRGQEFHGSQSGLSTKMFAMKVQARAGQIYVDDGGQGELSVVFIHSLAGNTRQWDAQLEHVRKRGCGIAIDMRGHGRSAPPEDGDYSLEAAADDIAAAADALGLDQFVLVGHSMGGGVAAVFAAMHPYLVRGLVLVDPVGDQRLALAEMHDFLVALESPRYADFIRAYWKSIAGDNDAVREQVVRDLERTPRAAVAGMLHALNRTNLTNALREYPGPKFAVITPHNNFPFSLQNVDPAIRHVVVEGTGHWLHMEKPAEFNAHLDDFLSSLQAANR
jgi:pimeloyl-ACP methyl ester carboxylesterase